MSKTLKIAEGLALPISYATKTAAILAQRRKGKTYAASVIAEEMVAAKQPFVVLDPTGAWWGLRSSADGRTAGLPVIILGGQHGDVALERTAGRVVADLVVDEPGYYVIDFSLFESGEAERQFAVDFAERLYRAKGQPGKDFTLHLFVDEADRFVPQQMRKGSNETSPRLLGAFEAIVRRGGLRGLGTTLISQRAAVVNKNVLEMLDVLIALRTVGPNDRKAIDEYVQAHGTDAERKALQASLASLGIGEAWVWEPGAEPAIFERVQIRRRHTFNSSATPEPGKARIEPRQLAAVDLEALGKRMAATIEKAKADDPKELRARLADAERRLQAAERTAAKSSSSAPEVEKNTKPAWTETERAIVSNVVEACAEVSVSLKEVSERFRSDLAEVVRNAVAEHASATGAAVDRLTKLLDGKRLTAALAKIPAPSVAQRPATVNTKPAPIRQASTVATADGVGKAEQKILDAIGWWNAAGITVPTRHQTAFVAGYTVNGHFNNLVGGLRTKGLIDYPAGGGVALTEAGTAAANAVSAETTRDELIDRVEQVLDPAPGRIFKSLATQNRAMSRDELAQLTGYTVNGHFNNMVGSLRSLGVIEYPHGGGVQLGAMFEALS